ncbi:MAG: HlyD family efflux transporter periplasmic adaptor subunit [Myxococcales bacterium]|nr:HlyD family efflux transporter periplasmic adaptor subunit [Myxococcales bacterium]
MNRSHVKLIKGVLPLLVLGAAALFAQMLLASREKPQRKPRAERAVPVEVEPVRLVDRTITVRANGSVTPAYSVDVMAEISGRVVWKHPQLTIGGLIKKGDTLLRIDTRDYKLALAQQQAALDRARTELELEQGRSRVAAQEWQAFGAARGPSPGPAAPADTSDLALRKPQMRAVELGLQSAETSLDQAKLKLGKTVLKAPFDAVVRTNATEVGRLVTQQQVLATLVNTDVFIVVVSLPVEDLQWLKIPGVSAPLLSQDAIQAAYASEDPSAAFSELASLALVTQTIGKQINQRPGIAVRLLGDLDPVGRMARLLVSVQDPMGRKDAERTRSNGELPILLGAYVNVELQGKSVTGLVEIPRHALRDGNRVHLMTKDGRLQVRDVEILRKDDKSVLVSAGLSEGELLITSHLATPVPGMELRRAETPKAKPAGAGREPAAGEPQSRAPAEEHSG